MVANVAAEVSVTLIVARIITVNVIRWEQHPALMMQQRDTPDRPCR